LRETFADGKNLRAACENRLLPANWLWRTRTTPADVLTRFADGKNVFAAANVVRRVAGNESEGIFDAKEALKARH